MKKVNLDSKWWTLDCDKCACQIDGICLWGVKDKRLEWEYGDSREHKPKHCEYFGKPPMRSTIVKRENRFIGEGIKDNRYVLERQLNLFSERRSK